MEFLLGWAPESFLRKDGAFAGLACAGPAERNTRCSRWTACLSLWGSSRDGPFSNQVELNQEGYFAAGEDCRTKLPGVFVAGDSRAKAVRQLTTAVGDGAGGWSGCGAVCGGFGGVRPLDL